MIPSSLVLIILAVVILSMSIKVIREDERIAVFRLGRCFRVMGPGLVLVLPVIDKVVKINLPENFPGWRGLAKEELEEKIKELVLR